MPAFSGILTSARAGVEGLRRIDDKGLAAHAVLDRLRQVAGVGLDLAVLHRVRELDVGAVLLAAHAGHLHAVEQVAPAALTRVEELLQRLRREEAG